MSGDDSALRALRVALGLAKPKLRVLLLGLERSGKSSWVQSLQPGGPASRGPAPPPTAAPRVERVVVRTPQGAFKLRCTDLPGGAEAAADTWPRFFAGAHAVVFVLDAADALRVQAAQDALDTALAHPALAGLPLLLLANKCDVAGAMSAHQAEEAVEPGACSGEPREWAVLACSAASGKGVQAGVEWLVAAAKRAVAKRAAAARSAATAQPLPEPAAEAEPAAAGEPRASGDV